MKSIEAEGLFVCLDHEDLVNLVISLGPGYDIMPLIVEHGLGYWTGGHVDKFTWNRSAVNLLDDGDLYHLYLHIKKYWTKD